MNISLSNVGRGVVAMVAAAGFAVACGAYEGEDYNAELTELDEDPSAVSEAALVDEGQATATTDVVEKSACFYGTLGGPTSCKSVATWKRYSHDQCVALGLTLTAYTPLISCGNGLYRYVRYRCC